MLQSSVSIYVNHWFGPASPKCVLLLINFIHFSFQSWYSISSRQQTLICLRANKKYTTACERVQLIPEEYSMFFADRKHMGYKCVLILNTRKTKGFLFKKGRKKELWVQAMATHSSTLAWKIPWTKEPGGLQSMGSLRVRHIWATSLSLFTFLHWRRKWQPAPVFLLEESQGWGSLMGWHLWGQTVGHDWSDLAAPAR